MSSNTYLMMVFIWKYKQTLEEEYCLTMDESLYVAEELVKGYQDSDEYSSKNDREVDRFLSYVGRNISDFL